MFSLAFFEAIDLIIDKLWVIPQRWAHIYVTIKNMRACKHHNFENMGQNP